MVISLMPSLRRMRRIRLAQWVVPSCYTSYTSQVYKPDLFNAPIQWSYMAAPDHV
jgi:hypothetical protein